jgi:hypothetical protein
MSTDERHSGGCACGAVRITATGAPLAAALCDCTSCRRSAGVAGVAWAVWPDEAVAFDGRPLATWTSPAGTERGFCDVCGTSLSCRMPSAPGHVDLTVAAFDDAATFELSARIHCADRLPWQDAEADLPRFDGWAGDA